MRQIHWNLLDMATKIVMLLISPCNRYQILNPTLVRHDQSNSLRLVPHFHLLLN